MSKTLKIGMVGLDTSHCTAFADILHDEKNPYHAAGGRIAAAFPGGSQACAVSRDRVGKFTEQVRDKYGIPIVDSLEALGKGMDAFFLESVDGRQHLEQFRVLARLGKPIFVDKPLACSGSDAAALLKAAREAGAPFMSCSSIRFAQGIAGLVPAGVKVQACAAFGQMAILEDYPAFYWYGIHSADVLFSFMGRGCVRVQTHHTDGADLIVGTWGDGRIGTLTGTRFEGGGFGCTVFTSAGVVHGLAASTPPYYALMLRSVMEFFRTGQPAIDPAETVEIMGFLEAAEKSWKAGGQPVDLPKA